jgi:hypothetical protein
VIWKRRPNGSLMRAMLITSSLREVRRTSSPSSSTVSVVVSMNTVAISRPTFSAVTREKMRAPCPSRLMNTAGPPVSCAMPEEAPVM